jgi:SNF2 family DNA or RNA helicase
MIKSRLYAKTNTSISFFHLKVDSYINLSRVYGAKYLKKKDLWIFPTIPPYHTWVIEDLETLLENLTIDPSAAKFLSRMAVLESKAVKGDTRNFSSAFPPYAHQRSGLARIMYSPRCAIFWDPGMGKTKLICDRILYERTLNPSTKTLILALRVNLSTWVQEMEIHSKGEEEIVPLQGTPVKRAKLLKKSIENNVSGVVCTYETARVSLELLSTYNYSIIVADECHKMQSYKSKLTKAALTLSKKATFRYVLSGTPTKGKPTDIWASLRFLGEFIVPTYWKFDKEYVKRSHYNDKIVIGYKNLDQLNEVLSHIADTRKSEDCLDLPDRTFQVIYCAPSTQQKKVYNSIVKDQSGVIPVSSEEVPLPNLLTKLSKLAQVCSGFIYKSLKDPTICDTCPNLKRCIKEEISPYTSKCALKQKDPGKKVIRVGKSYPLLEHCVELCSSHLENGKKVIVWAKHRETLEVLYTSLTEKFKNSVLRYDSTTENPGEVEKQFNTIPDKKILVAQITMGIGVTFKAPIMVYTELSFNLADWLQSLDRNWGIRAKGLGAILVQVLLIKGSISEQTYNLLKHKVDIASIIKDTPSCTTCTEILDCIAKDIKPYDTQCILDSSVPTLSITLKEIL